MSDTTPSEDRAFTSARRVADATAAALAVLTVQASPTDELGVPDALDPSLASDAPIYAPEDGPTPRLAPPDDPRPRLPYPAASMSPAATSLAAARSLFLDNLSVSENIAAGGAIAGVTVDDDLGDTHQFTVSDPRFEIVNGQLRLTASASLGGADVGSLSLVITVTDQAGNSAAFAVSLVVSDAPEPVATAPLSPLPVAVPMLDPVVTTPMIIETPMVIATPPVIASDAVVAAPWPVAEPASDAVVAPPTVSDGAFADVDEATLSDESFALIAAMLEPADDPGLDAESAPPDDQSLVTRRDLIDDPSLVSEPEPAGDQSPVAQTGPTDDPSLVSQPAPADDQTLVPETGPTDDPSLVSEPAPTDEPTTDDPSLNAEAAPADDPSLNAEAAPADDPPTDDPSLNAEAAPTAPASTGATDQDATVTAADVTAIAGTDAADVVSGTASAEAISGLGGNDTIVGNAGSDILDGGAGNDRLAGGAGNDTLIGAGGNDVLDGGTGDDSLAGGAGNDAFVFARGFGNDTIDSFDADAAGGHDLLILAGLGIDADNFAAEVVITDLGADTQVSVGANTITLLGVDGADANGITADDFRFL